MRRKYTNSEMDQMLSALEPLLERRDVIGYAAARNTRVLRQELTEYQRVKDELVMKYGREDVDEEGRGTGQFTLLITDPNFRAFAEEIERFAGISHEPELFKIKYEEAIGVLSGSEMLACEWMFED